jgi:hypothetical protein
MKEEEEQVQKLSMLSLLIIGAQVLGYLIKSINWRVKQRFLIQIK